MQSLYQLDFNLLKTLFVLLEERNVTRTAQRLAITQPAVSGALNRLRYRLGDPLFVRSSRGIIPTERAQSLYEPLKKIMGEIETLVQPNEFEPFELERIFTIGSTDNAMHSIGVPLALHLQQVAPKVRLVFLSILGKDIETMLSQGDLDLAFLARPAVPEKLRAKLVQTEKYVCAVNKSHPILQEKWTIDAFCRLNFVLVSYFGGSFIGAVDRALEKLGKSRRVALSVQNFLLVPEILRQSDYAAVLPNHLVANHTDLVALPLPFALADYENAIAWHDRTQNDIVHKWFRTQVEMCLRAGS